MSRYLTDLKPQRIVASNHSDWLKLRKGIGSSDIATLLGYNKWSTPYQLWLDKTGKVPHEEKETEEMRMGHVLEPIVAQLWNDKTNIPIIDGSEEEYVYVHPELDFLRASPDREFGKDGITEGILECKTTQLQIEADNIPMYWFLQVQYQLGIGQIDYANIAWLIRGHKFDFAEIFFNENVFEYEVEAASEFWEKNVKRDIPPECKTMEDAKLRFPKSLEKEIAVGQTSLQAYSRLKEILNQKKELESEEVQLKAQLMIAMQDCEVMTYEGQNLCTWKSSKGKKVFDTERFKLENSDLYSKYLIDKEGTRTFRIK